MGVSRAQPQAEQEILNYYTAFFPVAMLKCTCFYCFTINQSELKKKNTKTLQMLY